MRVGWLVRLNARDGPVVVVESVVEEGMSATEDEVGPGASPELPFSLSLLLLLLFELVPSPPPPPPPNRFPNSRRLGLTTSGSGAGEDSVVENVPVDVFSSSSSPSSFSCAFSLVFAGTTTTGEGFNGDPGTCP